MPSSRWHKLYAATVDAPPAALFRLLYDMPNYSQWLPGSGQFGRTTDVDPYPVQLGTRYHDGKPGESGKSWWGTVTGFQPSGSIDFHHTITVTQLRATVEVHIHYSFEPDGGNEQRTRVNRWLLLDIAMPLVFHSLKPLITSCGIAVADLDTGDGVRSRAGPRGGGADVR